MTTLKTNKSISKFLSNLYVFLSELLLTQIYHYAHIRKCIQPFSLIKLTQVRRVISIIWLLFGKYHSLNIVCQFCFASTGKSLSGLGHIFHSTFSSDLLKSLIRIQAVTLQVLFVWFLDFQSLWKVLGPLIYPWPWLCSHFDLDITADCE